jgi:hypothetical protein
MKVWTANLALACLLFISSESTAEASASFFTNQNSFNTAVTGPSFTINLSSLPSGQISSPATFSGNELSVQALSTNTSEYGLFSFGNGLTTDSEGFDLVFTNFSPNVIAFGGTFFNLDTEGTLASGNIILSALFADFTSMTTTNLVAATSNFFGFISETSILSLTVSGGAGLPATGQLTLGAPVPEPTTWALLVLSAGALAAARARFRGRCWPQHPPR